MLSSNRNTERFNKKKFKNRSSHSNKNKLILRRVNREIARANLIKNRKMSNEANSLITSFLKDLCHQDLIVIRLLLY
jgi:biotin synthase-related radical SAM superfamily protein